MSKKNISNLTFFYWIVLAVVAAVLLYIYFATREENGNGNPAQNTSGALSSLVGAPLPNFSLKDRAGEEYSSENLKGKKVILFFNEGIMCYPSCWNQMVALANDGRFQSSDTVALSVVVDAPTDWQMAIGKMPELGKANMVFDVGKSASRKFGMLTLPSSMHYGSFPGHTYVLIDKKGIVRYVYDDPRMAINNDLIYQEYLKLN